MGKNDFLFIPTLKLNLLRSFCTGILFSIIFITNITGQNANLASILLAPFFLPILTFVFWIVYWITDLIGLGGVGSVMVMMTTVPGDPLVYMLFKIKPEWKIVEKFNFFNIAGLIFVYHDYQPSELKNIESTKNDSCPYEGSILSHKETTVLGFIYPYMSPIFKISNDWKVFTTDGSIFGWIARNGEIHKDNIMPGSEVNIDASLSGNIIGKIQGNSLYVNNEKVGDLLKN